MASLDGIIFSPVHPVTGAEFTSFYAERSPSTGPGWYVWGRHNAAYGIDASGKGLHVRVCARPDVPRRLYKTYGGRVYRGWRTKKEAQAVADQLNAMAARGELPKA